jgi:hypothetical protein
MPGQSHIGADGRISELITGFAASLEDVNSNSPSMSEKSIAAGGRNTISLQALKCIPGPYRLA